MPPPAPGEVDATPGKIPPKSDARRVAAPPPLAPPDAPLAPPDEGPSVAPTGAAPVDRRIAACAARNVDATMSAPLLCACAAAPAALPPKNAESGPPPPMSRLWKAAREDPPPGGPPTAKAPGTACAATADASAPSVPIAAPEARACASRGSGIEDETPSPRSPFRAALRREKQSLTQ